MKISVSARKLPTEAQCVASKPMLTGTNDSATEEEAVNGESVLKHQEFRRKRRHYTCKFINYQHGASIQGIGRIVILHTQLLLLSYFSITTTSRNINRFSTSFHR